MSYQVAIDPGTHGCGLAVFEGGRFLHAEFTSGLGGQITPVLEPLACVESVFRALADIDELVVEIPKIYDTPYQKGDQRDLIKLALVAGSVLAAARPFARSALPIEPWEWKGQTPKEVTERQLRAVMPEQERALIVLPTAASLHHNVWDSIGIGRWRFVR